MKMLMGAQSKSCSQSWVWRHHGLRGNSCRHGNAKRMRSFLLVIGMRTRSNLTCAAVLRKLLAPFETRCGWFVYHGVYRTLHHV